MKLKKPSISKLAIILVVLIVAGTINNLGRWKYDEKVIIHDIYAFYAYLPATFIHHDLTLSFIEGTSYNNQFILWPKITDEGKKVFTSSMGMASLYFPFFLTAHIYATTGAYPADGYSLPYRLALILSSFTFLVIGLVYLRRLLLNFFSEWVVAIVLLIIPLATNMLWYTVVESAMSHVYNFALISVFLYHTNKWHEQITLKRSVYIGLLSGLITLIRPTNIIVLIIFALWKTGNWNDIKKRLILFLQKWHLLLIMIISFVLVWTPQMLYWKLQTGHYFYYSYPDDQGFFFANPQIWNTLFSWRKGWLLYTPIMIFALTGIVVLRKSYPKLFIPILTFTIINIYVISSWWDWWYGGGFGLRAYIDMYGVMAIPLAAMLTWISERKRVTKYILIFIFALTTAKSIHHHFQYHYGSIHWVSMTKEAYIDSFWRISPSKNFQHLLKNPDYNLARKGIYKYEGEN